MGCSWPPRFAAAGSARATMCCVCRQKRHPSVRTPKVYLTIMRISNRISMVTIRLILMNCSHGDNSPDPCELFPSLSGCPDILEPINLRPSWKLQREIARWIDCSRRNKLQSLSVFIPSMSPDWRGRANSPGLSRLAHPGIAQSGFWRQKSRIGLMNGWPHGSLSEP